MQQNPISEKNTKPLFLVIDGSNLYWRNARSIDSQNAHGETFRHPEFPKLHYVEAIVAFCLINNIAFMLYFDSPAPFHFEAADKRGLTGINQRFQNLRYLQDVNGNIKAEVVQGGEADPEMLRTAREGNLKGYDSYIVTSDKFRQDKFSDFDDVLGQRDPINQRPERILVATPRALPPDITQLTFERFPRTSANRVFWIPVEKTLSTENLQKLVAGYKVKSTIQHNDEEHQQAPFNHESGLKIDTALQGTQASSGELLTINLWPLTLKAEPHQIKRGSRLQEIKPDGSWSIVLGRDDGTNASQLHAVIDGSLGFVSGKHLRLDHDATTSVVTVTDLSTNGTWLDEGRLTKGVTAHLNQAQGVLTLSGNDQQSGAVSLMFTLANVSYEAEDESGQTVRRETKARMMERTSTTIRANADRHQQTTASENLLLHILYPDGNECVIALDIKKLPFSIGSAKALPGTYGTHLNPAIAPGAAALHLTIQPRVVFDANTNEVRALNVRCENIKAGYAIDGFEATDKDLVLNVNRSADVARLSSVITLAPSGTSFAAKLWLSN